MIPSIIEENELTILEHELVTFDSPPIASDVSAYLGVFQRIRSFCEPRLGWEYAAALLLSAYSKHPALYTDSAVQSAFLEVAERCWNSGVAVDAAHWQVGMFEHELGHYDRALRHLSVVTVNALGTFWGSVALECRVACNVRLRRWADLTRTLEDYVWLLETDPDHVAIALCLDRALREMPDTLSNAGPTVHALLKRVAARQPFRWFAEHP